MALIVETGAGLANSESYISVADADAYHVARGNEAAWKDLDTDVKEQLLRKATDYMTQEYRNRWTGMRMTVTQGLDWPRAWVPIPDSPSGYRSGSAYLPNNAVPLEVARACAELALMAKDGALAPNIERSQSSVKIGEISITYDPRSPEYTRFRSIDLMLKMWISSGVGIGLIRT